MKSWRYYLDQHNQRHRAVLISIALSVVLVPLNSTMVAVVLPDIIQEFRVDGGAVGWLVTAYLITMAALQLVAGKLGDQFGRRRFVLGGLMYFGLSSLLAALSPGLPILIFARVQQAIAGAVLITNGTALAFEVVAENRRGSELGLLHAVIVLAAAVGPLLSSLLVGVAGWRAVFGASVPIAAAGLLFGWLAIPESMPQTGKNRFDWSEVPSLFQNRTFASANGAILLSNLAMYVTLLAIPLMLSTQTGWTSFQTGPLLAAMSITMAVFAPLGGRLSDRLGKRFPSITGSALLTLGVLPLAVFGGTITPSILLVCLGLGGIGLGLSSVSLQTSVLETAYQNQTGLATGISSTSRYIGSILGSSLLASMLGSGSMGIIKFQSVFLAAALAAGLGIIMSWWIDR